MKHARPSPGLALPTCRLCHSLGMTRQRGKFVEYAKGHYAHQKCFIFAGKDFHALPPEKQAEFPNWLLRRFGIERKM